MWTTKYQERWKPKTEKKITEAAFPTPAKPRIPKRVQRNHFISAFFLRDYWSSEGNFLLHEKAAPDAEPILSSAGRWGFQRGLYSAELEDRFSLIEGDAKQPLRKVLNMDLLNDPERTALLGFLIVQKIRNPNFRTQIIQGTKGPVVDWVGIEKADSKEIQQQVFEQLFDNNKFYNAIAHPLFWSRWVILRSDLPVFVLPDTSSILAKIKDRQVLFAPLTPRACFVCTHLPERARNLKEALPTTIVNSEMAVKVSAALMATSNKKFVSGVSFVRLELSQSPESLLNEILDEMEVILNRPLN